MRFGKSTAQQAEVRDISATEKDVKLKSANVVFTTPDMAFNLLQYVVHI